MKLTKKAKNINSELGNEQTVYSIADAITKLQSLPKAKFVESIDLAVKLGVDPKKSDQNVRGSAVLPNGTGKTVKVAVFSDEEEAASSGADIYGVEKLTDSISKGNIDFDVLIATPSSMRSIGKLAQILGPKGLMPNPKVGTVTTDIKLAVNNAKSGQVQFRTEKAGIVHCSVGKINFKANEIIENIESIIDKLKKLKPATSKGQYIKNIAVSSTMGPGLSVDIASVGK